jgi:phosphatidylglycerol:prolipoprotein diacylglycerol transferase
VSPIGLFFGRLANFINGELWGRTSDVAWAMVFPRGGPLPRHPSQLYQAFFEGIALFAVMMLVWRLSNGRHRPGLLTGVFFAGYGVARIVGELFREPDAHLGYLWGPITMGMLLSVPLLFIGAWLITRAYARPAVS